ncbi:hypothetical protein TV39_09910 [Arthrobacter sp. SPG23]|uniref:hypothetical protein n=1 Tax=Arthrobacter sp. SPG23 TaxID=1610703 RepID=UPI0005BA1BF4|nr:hypothetical protein [Arthrobacter sp. SPG23]KIS27403.1 hypothetical protein TV39_09910 [Arthrobacter sp. SPG23]
MKSERLDMTQHRNYSALKVGALAVPTIAALALTGCSAPASGSSPTGGAQEFSLSFATSNTIESRFQVRRGPGGRTVPGHAHGLQI